LGTDLYEIEDSLLFEESLNQKKKRSNMVAPNEIMKFANDVSNNIAEDGALYHKKHI